MAVLSWGKPKIEKATSTEGAPVLEWAAIPTPKEDSTTLTPTAGTELEAKEEGGDIVDSLSAKNEFTLEFDIYVKKGEEKPFVDNDGVVDGEFALRLSPEDTTCEGFQLDRCKIRAEQKYTAKDGILMHYVCKALKPASGNKLKPYTVA